MMGMCEPLQNYGALVPALNTMLDDHAYALSRSRVTVAYDRIMNLKQRLERKELAATE